MSFASSLGWVHGTTANLTGSSIRVGGTGGTVITSGTVATIADATDGVGSVTFSTQYFGAGSGSYTSFYRLQNNGSEQGYNSYASGSPPMDQKNGGPGTPETVLGPIAGTTINEMDDARIVVGGQLYYQFTLDLNEDQSTGRWISLDNVTIYTSTQTTDPKYASLAAMEADLKTPSNLDGLNPIWRMDYGSTNSSVLLNANLTPGSGNDNMVMLVPASLFAGVAATDHVYMYSQFGVFNSGGVTTEYLNGSTWTSNSFVTESTFEEWALYTQNAIPEPTTLGIVGLGVFFFSSRRSRNRRSLV